MNTKIRNCKITHSINSGQAGFAPIALLIGAIVVLVVAGGVFLYKSKFQNQNFKSNPNDQIQNQQSTTTENQQNVPIIDETVNWKTYRNDQYGFEVKYPINMVIDFEKNLGWSFVIFDPIVAKSVTGTVPEFGMLDRVVDSNAEITNKFNEGDIDLDSNARIYYQIRGENLLAHCNRIDNFKTADSLKGITLCNRILSTFKFIK